MAKKTVSTNTPIPQVDPDTEAKEVTLQDRVNDLKVQAELYPENTGIETEDKGTDVGPRILAIAATNRKGRVMLRELKDKGLNVITTVEADLVKDPVKVVKEILKKEEKNDYQVVYISISNTDINSNPQYEELRRLGVPVNLYFDGHDDIEISNKAFKYKIE